MKTTSWFACVLLSTSVSLAGCATDDADDVLDDDAAGEAEQITPAQDNEPTTQPTGGCSATSAGGTTISSGTYETDDDGYLWCCSATACVECGGSNTCKPKTRGVLVPTFPSPPIKAQ